MEQTKQQLPKYHETFIPVLHVLEEGETLHFKDLKSKVREKFYADLAKDLLVQKTSTGANTLLDRIGWGVSYLSMAGYVQRPKRGYYQITSKGKPAVRKNQLSLKELKGEEEYIVHANQRRSVKKENTDSLLESSEEATPDDLIDRGVNQLNQSVKNELFEKITDMNPYAFEPFVLKLFKAMGYGEVIETSKSNDGGIDGKINQDKLGLEKIYVQVKRFNDQAVREKDIRNFIGAMSGDTTKGIFVTTSTFDKKAEEKANSAHHKIKLIDGEALTDLLFEYGIGLQTKSVIEIKEVDNDFFDE